MTLIYRYDCPHSDRLPPVMDTGTVLMYRRSRYVGSVTEDSLRQITVIERLTLTTSGLVHHNLFFVGNLQLIYPFNSVSFPTTELVSVGRGVTTLTLPLSESENIVYLTRSPETTRTVKVPDRVGQRGRHYKLWDQGEQTRIH